MELPELKGLCARASFARSCVSCTRSTLLTLSLSHMYVGYLRKKSRQDRWQRRYFEATTHYLTYYKVRCRTHRRTFSSSHSSARVLTTTCALGHVIAFCVRAYEQNRESEKLLACIDLWRTQNIELNAADPAKTEFSIGIGEQSYLLKVQTDSRG